MTSGALVAIVAAALGNVAVDLFLLSVCFRLRAEVSALSVSARRVERQLRASPNPAQADQPA